jgi:hypothetical protein
VRKKEKKIRSFVRQAAQVVYTMMVAVGFWGELTKRPWFGVGKAVGSAGLQNRICSQK